MEERGLAYLSLKTVLELYTGHGLRGKHTQQDTCREAHACGKPDIALPCLEGGPLQRYYPRASRPSGRAPVNSTHKQVQRCEAQNCADD